LAACPGSLGMWLPGFGLGGTDSDVMFVVNTFRHNGAVSARSAKLRAVWLLRSAGGRTAETTVSRL
jgi:hypothetical protein